MGTTRRAAPAATWLGSVAALYALTSPAAAATRHVDDDAPPGGDGSAANPWADLQAAIDAAADGDEILVADGTYAAIAIVSKQLHLFGGYDAAFTTAGSPSTSILEGTAAAATVTLYETGDTIVDGFVIRGGQRGVSIDADFRSTTNRPLVRNNVIENNGDPTVLGGAVYALHCDASLVGNTVRANIGDRGSGIAAECASILIEDNLIEDNVSHGDHGGGLYLTGPAITVRGNVIRNNEVGAIIGYGWGAGVTVFGPGVDASFEHNTFTDNFAQSVGSGAFVDDGATAWFDHDLFFANRCPDNGGAAVYADGYATDVSSTITLVHVTIADHDCPDTLGNAIYVEAQSTVELVDSIVWGNAGDDFSTDATSTITARYTLSDEAIDGVGNLVGVDPLFADPAGGDYHVRSTVGRFDPARGGFVLDDVDSPTIDAGDPSAEFALEPGPNGLRVNLGHTGNTAEASKGGPGGTDPTGTDGASDGDPSDGPSQATSDGGPGGDDPSATGPTTDVTDGPTTAATDGRTGGCGCTAGPPPGGASLAAVLWCAARRRRRRARGCHG